jgi:acid phosphatase (class A)
MLLTKRVLLAGVAAALFAGPALAAEPFVTAETLDLTTLLPPPPLPGSAQDNADLAAAIEAQKSASPARRAQASADAVESVYVMFTPVLGDKFAAANLAKFTALFDRVGRSEGKTVDPAKKLFARPRPWQAHAEVEGLAPKSASPAYPSGHTTKVTMFAIVLSEMLPEKRREIWARAYDYSFSRMVLGMHYPTDLEAGHIAGAAIITKMRELPEYQAGFAAAKAEVRAVLGM